MPFNMAAAGVGGRFFPLSISAEDLSSTYDVESEISSQFGTTTKKADIIQLTVAAVNVIAATVSGYAIDADGVHDEAQLEIILTTGCLISGRGGAGGNGGRGEWEPETSRDFSSAGSLGENGGTAIRYGCPTTLSGTGTISKGYGGGGGGGGYAADFASAAGGGGGGGGVPLGAGGLGGNDDTSPSTQDGVGGNAATTSALGTGGAGGTPNAGDGGDGGESGTAQTNGSAGSKPGGLAGSDGDAIDTQTFSHTAGGGVTIVGSVV